MREEARKEEACQLILTLTHTEKLVRNTVTVFALLCGGKKGRILV